MSRVFFRSELETAATYWRIFRRDGVTFGFISHDRDLWFDGIRHRAAPGMLPSAIRRNADLASDSAEMSGVLTHDSITEDDLAQGKYDLSRVEVGIIDWQNLDRMPLYFGSLGEMSSNDGQFSTELRSSKFDLEKDTIPRTSPTCRAQFCGPGCNLSATKFTVVTIVTATDPSAHTVQVSVDGLSRFIGGQIRWWDGPLAGQRSNIIGLMDGSFILDSPLPGTGLIGARVAARQGCDHRYVTCASRFNNSINFQGEPFLPGNDLLVRVPEPQ